MTVIHTVLSKCGRRARRGFSCQHREQTLIFKHHILFIVRACLRGKILNLACQHQRVVPTVILLPESLAESDTGCMEEVFY